MGFQLLTIIISLLAVLISVYSLQYSMSKFSYQKANENINELWHRVDKLLNYSSDSKLLNFKFELQNFLLDRNDRRTMIQKANEYSLKIGKIDDLLTRDYTKIYECVHNLYLNGTIERKIGWNKFEKWFSLLITDFYQNTHSFYLSLYEMSDIVDQVTLYGYTDKVNSTIDRHYDLIKRLSISNKAIIILKNEILSYVNNDKIKKLGIFFSSKLYIKQVKSYSNVCFKDFGIKEAIYSYDYSLIKKKCDNFAEGVEKTVEQERNDFKNQLKNFAIQEELKKMEQKYKSNKNKKK